MLAYSGRSEDQQFLCFLMRQLIRAALNFIALLAVYFARQKLFCVIRNVRPRDTDPRQLLIIHLCQHCHHLRSLKRLHRFLGTALNLGSDLCQNTERLGKKGI